MEQSSLIIKSRLMAKKKGTSQEGDEVLADIEFMS